MTTQHPPVKTLRLSSGHLFLLIPVYFTSPSKKNIYIYYNCVTARTRDFWCASRHSSKWARVRSTDFLTLLRDVLPCHVSPSAMLWYQSGCTAACSAMNLAAVISMRPPLPHTDTVWGRRKEEGSMRNFVRRLMEISALKKNHLIQSKDKILYGAERHSLEVI